MAAQTASAITTTTRCPQCAFHHDGAAGSLCATCEAQNAAGPLLVVERREDWAVHAAHLHFPATSVVPGANGTQTEATEQAPPQEASVPAPPATPASVRPRRPPRQTPTPQVCAYEPCSHVFTPKKAGQRFHTVACSARWRVTQDAGKAQFQRATALAHTPTTRLLALDAFVVQVRAQLTALDAITTVLRTRLEAQHAVLDQHERQAEYLRRYLALTEEPSP